MRKMIHTKRGEAKTGARDTTFRESAESNSLSEAYTETKRPMGDQTGRGASHSLLKQEETIQHPNENTARGGPKTGSWEKIGERRRYEGGKTADWVQTGEKEKKSGGNSLFLGRNECCGCSRKMVASLMK